MRLSVFLLCLTYASANEMWGSFRPQAYFGLRTRPHIEPRSNRLRRENEMSMGLMWGRADYHITENHQWRHKTVHDEKVKYGWEYHDGRSFGLQSIDDKEAGAKFDTSFMTFNGTSYSSEWSARINGTVSDKKRGVTFFVYFYSEKGFLNIESVDKNSIKVKGNEPNFGNFTFFLQGKNLGVSKRVGSADGSSLHYLLANVANQGWRVNELLREETARSILSQRAALNRGFPRHQGEYRRFLYEEQNIFILSNLPDKNIGNWRHQWKEEKKIQARNSTDYVSPNIVAVQVFAESNFDINFGFIQDIDSIDDFSPIDSEQIFHDRVEMYSNSLANHVNEFNTRFDNTFQIKEGTIKNGVKYTKAHVSMAKSALANLLGGMGYFHGDYFYQDPLSKNGMCSPQVELFTAVPSRPFFPRGFIWDEGFHQLVISKWDPELSISSLCSWFELLNDDGYIPREVALSPEGRFSIPSEFATQFTDHANPPTLLIAFEQLVNDGKIDNDFLQEYFPRLERWYEWFLRTQKAEVNGTFCWKGRAQNHTFSSGLDDYPRANVFSSSEMHLDLLCWMIKVADILQKFKVRLNISGGRDYSQDSIMFKEKLREYHLNNKTHLFSDSYFGVKNFKKELRMTDRIGYITLFPFFFHLIEKDSPEYKAVLRIITSSKHIYSDFGTLSLSREDPYFGQGENYWRGPIWVNMNYMLLQALKEEAAKYEKVQVIDYKPKTKIDENSSLTAIHTKLWANLVTNMAQVASKTGYVWENYDANDGHGKGTHPFTGWSALIINLLADG